MEKGALGEGVGRRGGGGGGAHREGSPTHKQNNKNKNGKEKKKKKKKGRNIMVPDPRRWLTKKDSFRTVFRSRSRSQKTKIQRLINNIEACNYTKKQLIRSPPPSRQTIRETRPRPENPVRPPPPPPPN